MSTDWDEVKRLAADFQRAQLSTAVQRLSERNCIEIVTKLIEKKLVNVLFTTDGKEYVTREHVLREIKEELFLRGGRIHLADLSRALSLDYSNVEERANELAQNDDEIRLVLGQLVDNSYLDHLFEEINVKLQQTGLITMGELSVHYDLPKDFLQKAMEARLGTIVHGQIDPVDTQVVFTEAFTSRHKARIRGSLLGATKPTKISTLISRYGLQERLFFNTLDELMSSGQLRGSLAGGRREKLATYIPDIYTAAKNDWIDSFYKQNNYLEYAVLSKLGIGDALGFIRKRYESERLTFLDTCAVNDFIRDQIEAAVEDQLTASSWVDVSSMCPSFFSDDDVCKVLEVILSKSSQMSDAKLFCDTVITKKGLVQIATNLFDDIISVKAEEASQLGLVHWGSGTSDKKSSGTKGSAQTDNKKDRKDERRKKAAGGKSGGGTQGRETKTKSTKKKYLKGGGGGDDSDDENVSTKNRGTKDEIERNQMAFLSLQEIEEVLKHDKNFEDCPEELVTQIAAYIEGPLTTAFQEKAMSIFLATSGSHESLRKTHGEVQDKINGLITNVHLFAKGTELFDLELKTQLQKHLLKTLCSDITNLVFGYVAQENMLSSGEQQQQQTTLTSEARTKLLGKFPNTTKDVLGKLNTTLNGKSVDDFFAALDLAMGPNICDMVIKKVDKKKEKQLMANHRQTLLQQLNDVCDPPLVLHLSVLILFQTFTQNLLHATGKFVPQILTYLEKQLPSEVHLLMHTYQGLVISHLTSSSVDEQRSEMCGQLDQMMSSIKEAAIATKKGTGTDHS